MEKDIKLKIVELRNELYIETIKDLDKDALEHVKAEYKKHNVNKVVDQVLDILLDSIGS